jgi:Response regulators consisting of a CheY-like receiver domain and a winged-helix DNA-binding domain
MKKILLVEDDANLGTPLASALEMQQYEVRYLTSGKNVMENMELWQPDIVLLDVMLGEEKDGFDLGREIRLQSDVPILFATSRDGSEDFKAGFGLGNSDYMRKPYKLQEVLARIDALLAKQKQEPDNSETIRIGCFIFKPKEQILLYNNTEEIGLNKLENAVFYLLCRHINTYVSRNSIIYSVWKDTDMKSKNDSLNNILSSLRRYLKADATLVLESKAKVGVRLRDSFPAPF